MSEFEVCTFCGSIFKGVDLASYPDHYEECKEAYKKERFDHFDWEQDYY